LLIALPENITIEALAEALPEPGSVTPVGSHAAPFRHPS
jgi:hypothetical protein